LTVDELEIYAADNAKHREHFRPSDVSLESIRRALFSFFGIKEPPSAEQLEKQIEKVADVKVTNKSIDAWFKAGMPSPATEWLREYEATHG
jgi:hypothetical protein